jgi:hypothetical protein
MPRNALTQDKPTLFISQYGQKIWAKSRAELVKSVRPGRVCKQYIDKKDGRTVWNGYVIGEDWFTAYHPAEVEALSR